MTFKPGETYKTRDGREARVYAVDGAGIWCIHGAIKEYGEWCSASWFSSGRADSDTSDGDLMPPKRELWVNVHKWKDGTITLRNHNSKRDAELYADMDIGDRNIARIRVEYTEGQFDD